MPPKVNGFVSNVNYYGLNNENENLTMTGVKIKSGTQNLQAGIGVDINIDDNRNITSQAVFEAKGGMNLGNGWSLQGRFRNFFPTNDKNSTQQYRAMIGKSFESGIDGLSFYATGHATTKYNDSGWNSNFGAWAGASYDFKVGSAFIEVQQNIKPHQHGTLENNGNRFINTGVTFTF